MRLSLTLEFIVFKFAFQGKFLAYDRIVREYDDDDLLTDLGEGRLGGPLERPTDP